MGRIKVVGKELGDYPYYVEMFDGKSETWISQVRYYEVKQDVKNYPDNKSRRNFKYLGKDED